MLKSRAEQAPDQEGDAANYWPGMGQYNRWVVYTEPIDSLEVRGICCQLKSTSAEVPEAGKTKFCRFAEWGQFYLDKIAL